MQRFQLIRCLVLVVMVQFHIKFLQEFSICLYTQVGAFNRERSDRSS
ncbi:hypothetical protein IC582_023636 [Cucumis melo]